MDHPFPPRHTTLLPCTLLSGVPKYAICILLVMPFPGQAGGEKEAPRVSLSIQAMGSVDSEIGQSLIKLRMCTIGGCLLPQRNSNSSRFLLPDFWQRLYHFFMLIMKKTKTKNNLNECAVK